MIGVFFAVTLLTTIYAKENRCSIEPKVIDSEAYINAALQLSKYTYWSIGNLPLNSRIRSDRTVAQRFMEVNGADFSFLAPELQKDKYLFLSASKSSRVPFDYLDNIQLDKQLVEKMILTAGRYFSLKNFPDVYKADKSIVMKVLKNPSYDLNDFDEKFKNDTDIADLAILGPGGGGGGGPANYYSGFFGNKIINTPKYIRRGATSFGDFSVLPQKIRNTKEYALIAVKNYPEAYLDLTESLKNDKDIALALVKGQPLYVTHLGKKIVSHPELIPYVLDQCDYLDYKDYKAHLSNRTHLLTAVKHCSDSIIKNLGDTHNNDVNFIINALSSSNYGDDYKKIFMYASKRLRSDISFLKRAVAVNPNIYKELDQKIKKRRDLALIAVKTKGMALKYLFAEYRDDKEIVLAALKNDPLALQFTNKAIRDNKAVVQLAIYRNPEALKYASNRLKNDKDLVIKAVRTKGSALKYASTRLKNDRNVVKNAIVSAKNNYVSHVIQYASDRLQRDEALQLIQVRHDISYLIDKGKVTSKKVLKKHIHGFINVKVRLDLKIVQLYFSRKGRHYNHCGNMELPMLWMKSDLRFLKPQKGRFY